MKKSIITMGLTLLASSALANVDPVVSEYQKIYGLQKIAPSLAETLIAVNARTAIGCDLVAPLDSLIKFNEVAALVYLVNAKGRVDDSDEITTQLDKATTAVCQSLISNMIEKPKAMSQLQKEISHIIFKYSFAATSGVDSETASKQLDEDFAELTNKYLNLNERAEEWRKFKSHYEKSLACGLASGEVEQDCMSK